MTIIIKRSMSAQDANLRQMEDNENQANFVLENEIEKQFRMFGMMKFKMLNDNIYTQCKKKYFLDIKNTLTPFLILR